MTNNNTIIQKQLSRIVIPLLFFTGLAIAFGPFTLIIYRPQFEVIQGHRYAWLPATIGLILCATVIIKFGQRAGKKHITKAIICVIVNLMLVCGSFRHIKIGFATLAICGGNMSRLGKSFKQYAQDHNDIYPDANSWCDELIKVVDVEARAFLCVPDYHVNYFGIGYSYPQPGIGKCHYAMNSNCKTDSSPDTVLLYETAIGWNTHGGRELLTFKNHRGDGCTIVFNNGYVSFETNPLELNWGEKIEPIAPGNRE